MRFRFELRALAQVQPWGADRVLHWFALTDGWYWIEVGARQLLRYSDETVRRRKTDGDDQRPFVDYYVVRLWEDLLRMLPDVLEPVPEDLQPFLTADRAGWTPPDDDDDGDSDFTAEIWYDNHSLDLGYLVNPPCIRWWRTKQGQHDTVTIDWRNRTSDADPAIAFAATHEGRVTIPTHVFLDAVRELDRDLMTAMAARITELQRHGTPPGIELDLRLLRTEHHDRTTWLTAALHRPPATDWDAVRSGAARLHSRQT